MMNLIKAMQAAGYREKYAMKHGTAKKKIINGHELYIYSYSPELDYQDANGATWDETIKKWIG